MFSAGPPSSPRIAISRPPTVNGARVELCWLRSLDSGGGSNLHYNIYVLESGDTEFRRVATTQPQSDLVCDSVELNGLSSYSVAVTAASGATNDPQNFTDVSVVQDRFILFYVTTCEPITGVCVCVCACVWVGGVWMDVSVWVWVWVCVGLSVWVCLCGCEMSAHLY